MNKNINYIKEDPHYKSIPLERFACKGHLVYSMPSACIDSSRYAPMKIESVGEKIVKSVNIFRFKLYRSIL